MMSKVFHAFPHKKDGFLVIGSSEKFQPFLFPRQVFFALQDPLLRFAHREFAAFAERRSAALSACVGCAVISGSSRACFFSAAASLFEELRLPLRINGEFLPR